MRIKDLAIFNPKGIKPKDFIVYIDTSSVEDGKLYETQTLDRDIPSRAQRVIEQNDLLISSVRPILRHNFFVKKEISHGIASTGFIQLRVTSTNVVPQYLFYFLTSDSKVLHYQTIAETSQSTFPSFNKDVIENIEFPNITISEQQHIVDILGSIDNSIENNNKLKDNLEDLAIKKYLSITDGSTDSIILNDLIELYDSKRIPLSSRERESRKGIYPYYGATGILDNVDNYIFSGEYILLAEDGTVIDENSYPIVQLVIGDFWVNNHAHILTAKNGYTNYSLYVALKRLSVSKAVTGAVQLKINQANLCALELPKIDKNTLNEFNKFVEPIFKKILRIKAENLKLEQLKALYLKKFFD